MRIRWTLPALRDMEQISSYIEDESSLAAANKICRTLVDSIQMLQNHPRLGKPGKRATTRELIEGKYVIVYGICSESVDILRVWHSAQDRH